MANIGYVRVSSSGQNTGRQFAAFEAKGIKLDKTYVEKVSGKDTNRPQLKAMLEYLREGDSLYVESFSRLARSTSDLLRIAEHLKNKNVQLISLKENIDTATPQGKFVFTMFAALSELERETIRERQREGIALCKAEGRPIGRPPATFSDTFEDNYDLWKAGHMKAVDFMQLEGLPKATFYKLVKRFEAGEIK